MSGEPERRSGQSIGSRTLFPLKVRGWSATVQTWIKDKFSRLPHALLFDLALVLAILAMLWTTVGMNLHQERRRAFQEGERDTSNLAGAAEQVLARTIEAVDQRILFIREAYRADRLGFSIDFLREENGFLDGAALQVAIIGPTGRLWMSNLRPVADGVDLSDRAHFRHHLDHPEDDLYISVPVLGRESGRWSIQFTRKLRERDGAFAGVVVVSLDPHWLTRLYESFDLGRAVLTLVGRDGVIRARAPRLDAALGRDVSGGAALNILLGSSHGTTRQVSPLDGVERIVSHRHVARYPLVVLVGRDVADFEDDYATYRYRTLLSGVGLTILVLVAGALLLGYRWRQIGSQRTLSAAIENITQGLILVDRRGRVPVHNRRFVELLGVPPRLMASSPRFGDVVRWQREHGEFGPSGVGRAEAPLGAPKGIVAAAPPPGSGLLPKAAPIYERVRPDGTVLEIRTQLLPDGGVVRTYADVTERRYAEERVRFLAHHDALTGLGNRLLLREQLEEALELAQKTRRTLAVLVLDVDGFKAVNDTLGHVVGDLLLVEVAKRLREAVGTEGVVARLGGDEFVILQAGAPDAIEAFGWQLISRLSEPYLPEGREARVGVSIGFSLYPHDGNTADDLLRRADIALYRAKAGGRGTLRFFKPEMEERSRERRALDLDLRLALECGGLALHYQPVFACSGGRITGFEALLRWTHPTRGDVPPEDFVAVAEESGLIQLLGQWVLERACTDAASWPGDVRVAVNLSPAQFRCGDLPRLVADTLARAHLPASRLELEVTEGLLIQDTDQALAAMTALSELGVTLALDDFGTGYSSMGYLQRFPFDRIKIDRSFIGALSGNEQTGAIVEAILAMAKSLRMEVTAEGVETREQLDFLCRYGCDEVQGFLLARPIAAEQIASLLATSSGMSQMGRNEGQQAPSG